MYAWLLQRVYTPIDWDTTPEEEKRKIRQKLKLANIDWANDGLNLMFSTLVATFDIRRYFMNHSRMSEPFCVRFVFVSICFCFCFWFPFWIHTYINKMKNELQVIRILSSIWSSSFHLTVNYWRSQELKELLTSWNNQINRAYSHGEYHQRDFGLSKVEILSSIFLLFSRSFVWLIVWTAGNQL